MEIIYLQTPFRNDNQRIILASMLYWHKPIFFFPCLLSSEFGLGYEWSPKHVTCYQGDTVKVTWDEILMNQWHARLLVDRLSVKRVKVHMISPRDTGIRSCKVEASRVWWIYSFIWLIRIHWLPNIPITFRDYPVHFRPFSQKLFYEHVYLCTAVLPWELFSIHPLPVIHL